MDLLFDQEYATKVHEKAIARDSFNDGKSVGREEGILVGREEGMAVGLTSAYVRMYIKGNISKDDAAIELKITADEFLDLVNKYRDENN